MASSPASSVVDKEPIHTLAKLKEMDDQRPGFPGEHFMVLAAGSLCMLAGVRSRSWLLRGIMMAAGTALVGRAASGRGGIAKVASAVSKLR